MCGTVQLRYGCRGTFNGSFGATENCCRSRQVQLATYTCVSTFVHMQLQWYDIYVRLCWPMRIVGIHLLSGTCPWTWLPKIYIVKGTHWNLRFDGVSGLYLWNVYLYLCRLQVFFDCGLCSSVYVERVLGDGLDSIGGCKDQVRFSFGWWVIGLGVGKVMSVGSSSVLSGGYGYLR